MARLHGRLPRIEGHRGWRAEWPENTLAGFEAALRAGVDAIELDVGLTSDGVVVVCHDPALDPDLTRGPDGGWIEAPGPLIRGSTLAALQVYDVGRARPGGPPARAFPQQRAVDGARVPTLAEVFRLAAPFGATVDVELKTDPLAPELTASPESLADAVLATATDCQAHARLALRSFDWRGLDYAAGRWPELPLTWLSKAAAEPAWRAGRDGLPPDSLAGQAGATWGPDHRSLTRLQIERAQALGLRVIPWTVNDARDLARLVGWGVDGVCTDEVARALDLVRQLRPA